MMRILLFFGLALCPLIAYSQTLPTSHRLTLATDSTAYSFSYVSPSKYIFAGKLPETDLRYYSLSRSLRFESLDRNLTLLIGKDNSGRDLIIFDENFNNDLSDDRIHYFTDTITSPTKGNYKHFKGQAEVTGQSRLIEFDYSIIKPKALTITFGDTLEDKIHFMIRPHQYRYAEVETKTTEYKLVIFSKTPYDFSKNSTFAVVVPAGHENLKSTDKFTNRYVVGDVMLIGDEKFLFQGISAGGDSIMLSKLNSQAVLTGGKVGFMSNDYLGQDILSNDSIQVKNMNGRFLLLDFWGTWCAPCIKILDDIKKMHLSLDSQKIKMIGVCYDNDIDKVKRFMSNRGIEWTQIFDPQSKSTVAKMFEISAYPSFVLIDPNGKIVFKDEGLDGFQRLSDKLKVLVNR
jgi:thiol-disulfide isomerase/thioredoxin